MIQSMTGYSRAVTQGDGWRVSAEMKAVNHRYCEIQIRLPKRYASVEERIRQYLADSLSRGKIDLYIKVEAAGSDDARLSVDKDIAIKYHDMIREISEMLGIHLNISASELIALPGVITTEEETRDAQESWELLSPTLDEAISQMVKTRRIEGARLAEDFLSRLDLMEGLRLELLGYAADIVENYRKRLTARITDLLGQQPVDESRLAQEAAMIADRAGVDEELVRLSSHIAQFRELLDSDEPVGRKLDFLCQEINREINTIGSKANDLNMTKIVVELKSELEKLREQTQNIR